MSETCRGDVLSGLHVSPTMSMRLLASFTVISTVLALVLLYKHMDNAPPWLVRRISQILNANHLVSSRKFRLSMLFSYRTDQWLSSDPRSKVIVLGISTAALVFLGWLALYSVGNISLYYSFWSAVDSAGLDYSSNEADSLPVRLVSLALSIGGMLITALLLTLVSESIGRKVDDLKKGKSDVLESGHIVVIGWSVKVFCLLEELCMGKEPVGGVPIVIIAEVNKEEMEEQIVARGIDTLGSTIICRYGCPLQLVILNMPLPNIVRCSAIIVLSTQDTPEESDARMMHIVMNLLDMHAALRDSGAQDGLHGHIVAEVCGGVHAELISQIASLHESASDMVHFMESADLIARLMVQCVRYPDLADVLSELVSFSGNECYIDNGPFSARLRGLRFRDLQELYPCAIPIGYQHQSKIVLNPPQDYVIKAGDHLLLIAEDENNLEPAAVTKLPLFAADLCRLQHDVAVAKLSRPIHHSTPITPSQNSAPFQRSISAPCRKRSKEGSRTLLGCSTMQGRLGGGPHDQAVTSHSRMLQAICPENGISHGQEHAAAGCDVCEASDLDIDEEEPLLPKTLCRESRITDGTKSKQSCSNYLPERCSNASPCSTCTSQKSDKAETQPCDDETTGQPCPQEPESEQSFLDFPASTPSGSEQMQSAGDRGRVDVASCPLPHVSMGTTSQVCPSSERAAPYTFIRLEQNFDPVAAMESLWSFGVWVSSSSCLTTPAPTPRLSSSQQVSEFSVTQPCDNEALPVPNHDLSHNSGADSSLPHSSLGHAASGCPSEAGKEDDPEHDLPRSMPPHDNARPRDWLCAAHLRLYEVAGRSFTSDSGMTAPYWLAESEESSPQDVTKRKSASSFKGAFLICGWRRGMGDLIRILDDFVTDGSTLYLYNEVPIKRRQELLEQAGLQVTMQGYCPQLQRLRIVFNSPELQGSLLNKVQMQRLNLLRFKAIMVMADELSGYLNSGVPSNNTHHIMSRMASTSRLGNESNRDSSCLSTVCLLRMIQQQQLAETEHANLHDSSNEGAYEAFSDAGTGFGTARSSYSGLDVSAQTTDVPGGHGAGAGGAVHIEALQQVKNRSGLVAELLDPKTATLVKGMSTKFCRYVIISDTISQMLALIACSPLRHAIFQELFSPQGNELIIRPSNELIQRNERCSFFSLAKRVGAMGETIIAFIDESGKAVVNPPDKAERILTRENVHSFVTISRGSS